MKKILYKLSWSGNEWGFSLGLTTPDGLMHMFEDGTLFTAGGRTSYASTTPEEAMDSAAGRITRAIEEGKRRFKSAQEELETSQKLLNILEKQKADLQKEAALIIQCEGHVEKFFKGDLDKTRQWFKSSSPLLGHLSPDQLIKMQRTDKLLKFIEIQLSENAPPA
jgi:hypothetical protein